MADLSLFATASHPLHPSGLGGLLVCPWRYALEHMVEADDGEGGPAADTGSAVHKAAAAMHKGQDTADCLKAMRDSSGDYPRADLQEAAGMFLSYASDPRNRDSEFLLVETKIAFQIAPLDPSDPPISVEGTCDQVRLKDGRYTMWDIKTSKKEPISILHQSTFQIAAYCIGASIKLGKTVHPGGVLMPRRYRSDAGTSPVFYHCPWTFADIEQILLPVRHAVHNVRRGVLWHMPNDGCMWCSQRSPDICLPRLQKELVVLRRPAQQ